MVPQKDEEGKKNVTMMPQKPNKKLVTIPPKEPKKLVPLLPRKESKKMMVVMPKKEVAWMLRVQKSLLTDDDDDDEKEEKEETVCANDNFPFIYTLFHYTGQTVDAFQSVKLVFLVESGNFEEGNVEEEE